MPTVFAGVSLTILLFYASTIFMAYFHLLPVTSHVLWGFLVTTLTVLLQCLVFGFLIGSGKSIKKAVKENGLGREWVDRTKDYKNKCYPPLMLAILLAAAAGAVGGGVANGSLPSIVHQALVWGAFLANGWSFWVSYKVVVENVAAIHALNREVDLGRLGKAVPEALPPEAPALPPRERQPGKEAANFYFLAVASWVPYLYMKFSLGSRTFPLWPFLVLSLYFFVIGWVKSRRSS